MNTPAAKKSGKVTVQAVVPLEVAKAIEADALADQTSGSHVIRRILARNYATAAKRTRKSNKEAATV